MDTDIFEEHQITNHCIVYKLNAGYTEQQGQEYLDKLYTTGKWSMTVIGGRIFIVYNASKIEKEICEDTNFKHFHVTLVDLNKEYHCDNCKTKVEPKCSRTYFTDCGVFCKGCVEEHTCEKCDDEEDSDEE